MSEVSSTAPGQRPPPTNTGGPSAVAKSNPTHDQPGTEQEKTDQKPGQQATAQQNSKSYYDPAVSVSPALAHLAIGQLVEGEVISLDGEGRPVLRTSEGTFALRPDAGLVEGAKVSIRITKSDKSVQGDLIARDGRRIDPPVSLQLTLIGIHPEPQILDPDLPIKNIQNPAQTSYSAKFFKPGFDKALAYEASSLSLPRIDPPAPLAPKPVQPQTVLQKAKVTTGIFNTLAPIPRLDGLAPPNIIPDTLVKPNSTLDTPAKPNITAANPQQPSSNPAITNNPAPVATAYQSVPATLILPKTSYPGQIISVGNNSQKSGPVQVPFQPGEKVSVQVIGNNPAKAAQPPGSILVQASIIPASQSPFKTPEGTQILQTPIGHIAIQPPKPLQANQIVAVAITAAAPATPASNEVPIIGQQPPAAPQTGQTFTQTQAKSAQNSPPVSVTSTATETPLTTAKASTDVQLVQKLQIFLSPPPELAEDWPILDDLYAVLTTLPPHIAGQLASRLPQLNAQLPNTLLFFTQALQIGSFREWAGPVATAALKDAGQEQLMVKLDEEFSRIGRLFADPQADGWRPLPLPLQTDQTLHILAVLVRPIFEDESDRQTKNGPHQNNRKKIGSRFVLEFDLSELGTLQLDGLIKGTHFELIIRSRQIISEGAKSELKSLFVKALQSNDMEGILTFEQNTAFPIIVTDLLTKIHHSDHHENVTI